MYLLLLLHYSDTILTKYSYFLIITENIYIKLINILNVVSIKNNKHKINYKDILCSSDIKQDLYYLKAVYYNANNTILNFALSIYSSIN